VAHFLALGAHDEGLRDRLVGREPIGERDLTVGDLKDLMASAFCSERFTEPV